MSSSIGGGGCFHDFRLGSVNMILVDLEWFSIRLFKSPVFTTYKAEPIEDPYMVLAEISTKSDCWLWYMVLCECWLRKLAIQLYSLFRISIWASCRVRCDGILCQRLWRNQE